MANIRKRWFDWYVIEKMTPTGTHTYFDGRQVADFDMTVRVRKWHPGYWLAVIRAVFRNPWRHPWQH